MLLPAHRGCSGTLATSASAFIHQNEFGSSGNWLWGAAYLPADQQGRSCAGTALPSAPLTHLRARRFATAWLYQIKHYNCKFVRVDSHVRSDYIDESPPRVVGVPAGASAAHGLCTLTVIANNKPTNTPQVLSTHAKRVMRPSRTGRGWHMSALQARWAAARRSQIPWEHTTAIHTRGIHIKKA
jgi:hypothetical protein